MTIDDLSPDDAVRLLVQARHSRRNVKRFLHDRNLPSGSDGVDAALAAVRKRPDFAALEQQAAAFVVQPVTPDPSSFDPIADIRRELLRLNERPGDFATRVQRDHGVPFQTVLDTLEGRGDPPLSALSKIFKAAGVTRLYFGANRRPANS